VSRILLEIFVSRFRATALRFGGLTGGFVESTSPRFLLAGAGSFGVRLPSVGSSVSRPASASADFSFSCERAATKILCGPFYIFSRYWRPLFLLQAQRVDFRLAVTLSRSQVESC
jgi:hypothetical protein